MFPWTIKYIDIPRWKHVLCCCSNFTPYKIPYEEAQDNIDITNINDQTCKGVGHCRINFQRPNGVTYICYLCHGMEYYGAIRKLKIRNSADEH